MEKRKIFYICCILSIIFINILSAKTLNEMPKTKTAIKKYKEVRKYDYSYIIQIEDLLRDGINVRDEKGDTALMISTDNNYPDITKAILDEGADVNIKNFNGNTALMSAAMNGHNEPAILYTMISKGADVNQKNNESQTALMMASRSGNVEMVKIFISKGADINANDELGQTPLMYASKSRNTEIVKLLISKGANVNAKDKNGDTSFTIIAAEKYDPLYINPELINKDLQTSKGVIMALFEAKADINMQNNKGLTPLIISSYQEDIKTFRLIISLGADVNKGDNNGATPLMHVFSNNKINRFKMLIEVGADVNAKDKKGFTLLARLSYEPIPYPKYPEEFIQIMIKKGADVNVKGSNGITPLMWASRTGNALVEMLDAKANIEAKDDVRGYTPLMYAVEAGNTYALDTLIKAGANVNTASPKEGITPLMASFQSGNKEAIIMLIENGANVKAKDKAGNTVLWHALMSHYTKDTLIGKILVERGASY